jgi:hypothetical protein
MYSLAVIALLGLGLFKLLDVLEDLIPQLARVHTELAIILGIAAAVAADYSVFGGFHTTFRDHWMGTWATGIVMGGSTSVWRALFHLAGSNEGDAPEQRHHDRPHLAA